MGKHAFLDELLGRLSPLEKAGQLNLLSGAMDATGTEPAVDLDKRIRAGHCGGVFNVFTPAATRALQELAMAAPNPIPLLFGYDVIHGHRTIFPIPLGLSCSWNPDLIEKTAAVAATEAAADGLHWVFSPMVDITQDARWGRVAEGSGEDPWLGAQIAAAMVRGYQGSDPSRPAPVLACVKHFALYGAARGGLDYHAVDMSPREMEETHFPPYRAAVDAGVRTLMTAFNGINGIPATANRALLHDLLRQLWGFQGLVVSDYTAIAELQNHGTAACLADCAAQAFNSGCDMDMMAEAFLLELPALLESGAIHMEQLDAAVRRVLEIKWDLGLFENPFAHCAHCEQSQPATVHLTPSHRKLARQAARESIVLLKNDHGLLPLAKTGSIALIGPMVDRPRDLLGCWIAAGDAADALSLTQGFREIAGDSVKLFPAHGCGLEYEDPDLLAEALRAAAHADVVVMVLGETWNLSGEATSRTDLRLPKCQRELAKRLLKTGKPCVLITLSGRPLDLSREERKFSTLLHAWAPGTEGAAAIAEIVFGEFAPVGKLTMGFPRSTGQLPMTYREKPTGRPYQESVRYSTHYLDCPNDALFPFGHGLTYGTFEMSEPTLDSATLSTGGKVTVAVDLTNRGAQPATETLQLYLRDRVASVSRPVKELRGYQRLTLAAGETRRVSFAITDADLAFPGPDFHPLVEPGDFDAMIGPDSAHLRSVRFHRE
jgi:beta-glucosidase